MLRAESWGKKAVTKIRSPEQLDRLSQLCWDEAYERAKLRVRKVTQNRDCQHKDGTIVRAGETIIVDPRHGLCESINWLAAEILERIEGTRWYAWRGRVGFVQADGDEAVITDEHVLLMLNEPDPQKMSPFSVFADFSLHSAFWEDVSWLPMAVRGAINQKASRGVRVYVARFDGYHDHALRIADPGLAPWLTEATERVLRKWGRE